MRLGMLCGPSNGFHPFDSGVERGRFEGKVDEDADARVHELALGSGQCVRVFASATAVRDLELEVLGPGGAPLGHANLNQSWVVFPEHQSFCAPTQGKYSLSVRTHDGGGPYLATVWTQ